MVETTSNPKSFSKIVDQVKELLNLGPQNLFGIDIGLSSVKIAEIKWSKNKVKILKFGYKELPEAAIIDDEIQKPEEIVQAMQDLLKELKIGSINCCLGLEGPNMVTKRLQLAGGKKEEVEDQVYWEGEQYFPFSMEECSFGFQILGENEAGGVDVIVGAGKNTVVANFKDLIEKAGLKLKIIDLGVISVTNVFEYVYYDLIAKSQDAYLILDMGAQKTSFIVFKNKGINFCKEIPIGGVIITEEILRQMGVNYLEAEDLKKGGDQDGNLPEEVLTIMEEMIESFFTEIKKSLDFYISSTGEDTLKTCYVTGGNALIPNILPALEDYIELKVEFLDLKNAFDWDKNITDEMKDFINYRGASAIGLAMRTPRD